MPVPRIHESNADKQRAYRERLRAQRDARNLGRIPDPAGPCNIPPRKRWHAYRDQAAHLLQTWHQEMQEYAANRSDAWQDGDRAAEFMEEMDALQELIDTLTELP